MMDTDKNEVLQLDSVLALSDFPSGITNAQIHIDFVLALLLVFSKSEENDKERHSH